VNRLVIAATLLCLPARARANGRFPDVVSLAIRADEPSQMIAGTTFGALLTLDGGETWRWICEDALGFGGIWDPVFAIEPGTGAMIATMPNGLAVSDDGGCTWTMRGGKKAEVWFMDVEIRDDGAWLLATATGGKQNGVYLSTDRGETMEPTSLVSDVDFFRDLLLRGDRATVVGYRYSPIEYTIHESTDGGESWSDTPIAIGEAVEPFAIDPADSGRIYMAEDVDGHWGLDRATTSTGDRSRLFEVDLVGSRVRAFAISDDGGTILAGSGRSDVRRSTDGGASFGPVETPIAARCFARTGDVVHACADNWEDGFAIGRSEDWSDSWTGLLRFDEIAGPVECPEGSEVEELCAPLFPTLCKQLAIDSDECPGGGGDADASPAPAPRPDGCGCNAAPALAFAILGVLRRRR